LVIVTNSRISSNPVGVLCKLPFSSYSGRSSHADPPFWYWMRIVSPALKIHF
jgi:hypothetical protein